MKFFKKIANLLSQKNNPFSPIPSNLTVQPILIKKSKDKIDKKPYW